MIRNIIVEWSGTLVDDLPAVLQASNFVLTQAGRPAMTLEEFREEFQLPFTRFYDRHTPHVPMAQLEAIVGAILAGKNNEKKSGMPPLFEFNGIPVIRG